MTSGVMDKGVLATISERLNYENGVELLLVGGVNIGGRSRFPINAHGITRYSHCNWLHANCDSTIRSTDH